MYNPEPALTRYGGFIHCRLFPNQRPCGISQCERTECVRAKAMAAHPSSQGPKPRGCWACYALLDEDLTSPCRECGRKPVTAPVEPVEVLCGPDGQWSITGLSEDDMYDVLCALGFVVSESVSYMDVTNEQRLEKIIGAALPD